MKRTLLLAALLAISTSVTALSISTPVFEIGCPWVVVNSPRMAPNPSVMNSIIMAIRGWFQGPSMMN